ncbi:hypothetical protein NDU88_002998 [Pleurodeles waltl]|uniref:Uncharacterized protein n=1 Tax=Pleurodeles waltl TaxID=8319 RepID=A0AAV7MPK4_PLEWA|nr:hypothetical protein NDU88_002998 [Pleurodeles waltl]
MPSTSATSGLQPPSGRRTEANPAVNAEKKDALKEAKSDGKQQRGNTDLKSSSYSCRTNSNDGPALTSPWASSNDLLSTIADLKKQAKTIAAERGKRGSGHKSNKRVEGIASGNKDPPIAADAGKKMLGEQWVQIKEQRNPGNTMILN